MWVRYKSAIDDTEEVETGMLLSVDVSDVEGFNADSVDVWVAGNFHADVEWAQPGENDLSKMEASENDENIYTVKYEIADLSNQEIFQYKFFLVFDGESSWENGEWNGDPNREQVAEEVRNAEELFLLEHVWADEAPE
ncbi:hypothetical protein BH23BAC3_BH23BAC3_33470 [soil metagenome]